ncbi:MAG: HNH endonuclease [Schaalia turicensis]
MTDYHDEYRQLSGTQRRALTDRIYARDQGVCHICRTQVRREDASLDHLIPVSRGGLSIESNLALAHLRCNTSRGAKTLEDANVPTHDGLAWFLNGV